MAAPQNKQNSVASAGRTLVCATPVYGSAGTFAVFTKADRVPTHAACANQDVPRKVLNVQNSLQAVLQLQYIKIAVVVQGAGDGKQVLGRLRPQLAYIQGCRWVADLHHLYSDEEGLKSDLPPQIQACGYEILWYLLKEYNIN